MIMHEDRKNLQWPNQYVEEVTSEVCTHMHSPTTVRLMRCCILPSEFATVQVQLPAWSHVTLVTVRLRVIDAEIPFPSETMTPLLSVHEMVGVGLPTILVPHTGVMSAPTSTARRMSPSGPTN